MPEKEITTYDVLSKKDYVQHGKPKSRWYKIGRVRELPNGKRFMQLFQTPDLEYYIFPKSQDQLDEEQLPEIQLDEQ